MSSESLHYIEDLSEEDIKAITHFLCLPGSKLSQEWLAKQETEISKLSPRLTKPVQLIARVAMRLPFAPSKAVLCKAHNKLNGQLIRRIFLQFTAECSTRLVRLNKVSTLPADVKGFIKRLESIHALWTPPAVYRSMFQVQPEDPRPERIDSKCEACIIAAIGGNAQMISDMRTAASSRRRKGKRLPRVMVLAEGWFEWFAEADEMRAESEQMARKVRKIRKEIQTLRRQGRGEVPQAQQKHHRKDLAKKSFNFEGSRLSMTEPLLNVVTADGEVFGERKEIDAEACDDGDTVADMIDFYHGRLIKVDILEYRSIVQQLEDLHTAYRDSVIILPEKTGSQRNELLCGTRRPSGTRSSYSVSDYGEQTEDATMPWLRSNIAQAGPQIQDVPTRNRLVHRGTSSRRSSVMTRWSDLYRDVNG